MYIYIHIHMSISLSMYVYVCTFCWESHKVREQYPYALLWRKMYMHGYIVKCVYMYKGINIAMHVSYICICTYITKASRTISICARIKKIECIKMYLYMHMVVYSQMHIYIYKHMYISKGIPKEYRKSESTYECQYGSYSDAFILIYTYIYS
jgi:hypothetical protein